MDTCHDLFGLLAYPYLYFLASVEAIFLVLSLSQNDPSFVTK